MTLKRMLATSVLSGVLLIVPRWCFASNGAALRVIDETGRGIANARVVDEAGLAHSSNVVGLVWLKRSRVGRAMVVSVNGSGAVTSIVSARNGELTLTVKRR